jgi:AraC-like DNA-binding protein
MDRLCNTSWLNQGRIEFARQLLQRGENEQRTSLATQSKSDERGLTVQPALVG